jgi:hypothetical protein
MTETPPEEPVAGEPAAQPVAEPAAQPAAQPVAQPAQPAAPTTAAVTAAAAPPADRYEFVRSRPFQVALAAAAGLVIGGIGGLGIGFAAGHHFDGGRHPHGYYQDGPRRDRMPMQPPRKINPQKPGQPFPTKPLPTRPAPTASPTA